MILLKILSVMKHILQVKCEIILLMREHLCCWNETMKKFTKSFPWQLRLCNRKTPRTPLNCFRIKDFGIFIRFLLIGKVLVEKTNETLDKYFTKTFSYYFFRLNDLNEQFSLECKLCKSVNKITFLLIT